MESLLRALVSSKYRKEEITILILVVAIALLFSSLYIYTENWPPAVIVESSSMQHGSNFVFGAINTGDIVGVKKINSFQNVQTYLVARERGSSINYGEYGNVIVYRNYLLNELVIHRAMFYVQGWDGRTPILYGDNNPSWLTINGYNVYMNDVGYAHKNLVVNLQQYVGQTGFVTMGDHNFATEPIGPGNYSMAADQNVGIDNTLVNATQVVGYAVGYLPVLGVMKLWVTGKLTFIPEMSNIIMVIILIAVAVIFVIPLPSTKGKKEAPRDRT